MHFRRFIIFLIGSVIQQHFRTDNSTVRGNLKEWNTRALHNKYQATSKPRLKNARRMERDVVRPFDPGRLNGYDATKRPQPRTNRLREILRNSETKITTPRKPQNG